MVNKLGLLAWALLITAGWYIKNLRDESSQHIKEVLWSAPVTSMQIADGTLEARLNAGQNPGDYKVSLEYDQSETDKFLGRKPAWTYSVTRKIVWPIGTGWIELPQKTIND